MQIDGSSSKSGSNCKIELRLALLEIDGNSVVFAYDLVLFANDV